MNFSVKTSNPATLATPVIVLGLFDDGTLPPLSAEIDNTTRSALSRIAKAGDIKGKLGDVLLLQKIDGCKAQRILLTFGGGDDYGATLLCLGALKSIGWSGPVDIVLGGRSPARGAIEEWVRGSISGTLHLHIDAQNMADRIANANLVISAGGTTSFETAALGAPTLLIRTVPNQRPNTQGWEALGAAIDLGDIVELTSEALGARINALASDQPRRIAMSEAGRNAIACRGAERIVEALCTDSSRESK